MVYEVFSRERGGTWNVAIKYFLSSTKKTFCLEDILLFMKNNFLHTKYTMLMLLQTKK